MKIGYADSSAVVAVKDAAFPGGANASWPRRDDIREGGAIFR